MRRLAVFLGILFALALLLDSRSREANRIRWIQSVPQILPALPESTASSRNSPLVEPPSQNEILELRDPYSRHFANPDGSITALVSPSPIHYEGEEGTMNPIDTQLRPTDGGFTNETNGL